MAVAHPEITNARWQRCSNAIISQTCEERCQECPAHLVPCDSCGRHEPRAWARTVGELTLCSPCAHEADPSVPVMDIPF